MGSLLGDFLIRSTAPNSDSQIGVKSAAQYQPLPTGRQAEHTPGFRPGSRMG
jgi:hypothetical protein